MSLLKNESISRLVKSGDTTFVIGTRENLKFEAANTVVDLILKRQESPGANAIKY